MGYRIVGFVFCVSMACLGAHLDSPAVATIWMAATFVGLYDASLMADRVKARDKSIK